MKGQFRIVEKEITKAESVTLSLRGEGFMQEALANGKLRIVAVFSSCAQTRRFPMEAVCLNFSGTTFFFVEQRISLPDVFYRFGQKDNKEVKSDVTVTFETCDSYGVWEKLDDSFVLPGAYFVQKKKPTSAGFRIFGWIAFFFCTILLPIWILAGYFAGRGFYGAGTWQKNASENRGALRFANRLVSEITGHGYSRRSAKTKRFAKIYHRACYRCLKPQGILLLSERKLEKGSNLDLIRNGLVERGKTFEEFVEDRPIDKLSRREIRQAANLVARAGVIVLEDFYPQLHALDLREGTKVMQLWHACGAFKMFGLSDIGKVSHLEQDTKNHRNYTDVFVSSNQMIPYYSEAFGISPECVHPLGVPRTDIFFEPGYGKRVAKRLGEEYPILQGKRIVLFAPTFRGSGNKDAYYPTNMFSVNAFLEGLPEDVVLIIKSHPFVKQTFTYFSKKNKDRVIDLSDRENINDLLFVTDLLITDYSSCIFEATLLSVPMFFYTFDLEEYLATRDLYFDLKTFVPGTFFDDFDEMKKSVLKFFAEGGMRQSAEYIESVRCFLQYFLGALDGNSTERVLDYILENTSAT